MLEKIYRFVNSQDKLIEKIVDDENLALNHVICNLGEGLPEHFSNSNVYLVIMKGILTIKLDEQEPAKYGQGNVVNIPYHVRMNINNFDDDILEFFIVKSPNPNNYGDR